MPEEEVVRTEVGEVAYGKLLVMDVQGTTLS